jgi:hypothetical protein
MSFLKITTRHGGLSTWRPKGFALLIRLFTVVLLFAGSFEFVPAWIFRNAADDPHLWHIAELTALATLLFGGVIVALWRRPETKPLLVQFLVLGSAILAIGIMPFDFKAGGMLFVAGLFAAVYPQPRALLSVSRTGSISKALFGLTCVFAVFLAPVISRELQWQIMGMTEGDVHALYLHWLGSALLMMLLILAGALASTKRPGWISLGVVTGIVYFYLGIIAMIVPEYAGSWGAAGGLFAIIGGVFYIWITLLEAQYTSQHVPMRRPEQALARTDLPAANAGTLPAYEPQLASEALPARTTLKLADTDEVLLVGTR